MTNFSRLKISDWKQFKELDLYFHHNITILTGANGSGKTTVLNLLSKHFGWNLPELATPTKDEKTGTFSFLRRWFSKAVNENQLGSILGLISYSNGAEAKITIPSQQNNPQMPPHMNSQTVTAQYSLQFSSQQHVAGLHIPSHRPLFFYQNVSSIPTQKRTNHQAYQLAFEKNSARFNAHGMSNGSVNFVIKETLISWAISGGGNQFMEADREMADNYLGFQQVLALVLPKSLGFIEISIRNYEVVMVTESGEFMIDGASGGISAVIDLAWQVYNYSKNSKDGCVVLIDEVENHLHPSMQRSILPDFIKAFPNVQFIVTTHSPLIVGSVKDSNVYALRYGDDRRVRSELLDSDNKSQTASEILNEVLDVPVTIPIWAEDKIREILKEYLDGAETPENAEKAFNALKASGFNSSLKDLKF